MPIFKQKAAFHWRSLLKEWVEMSLLEPKSLMSLGAKELGTGQVSEASCDLAERQGRTLHRRPIKFLTSPLRPKSVRAKGPQFAEI